MEQTKKWDAKSVLAIEQSEDPYAFIVLNRQIQFKPADFQRLWNRAAIRVLVDGGANHWFEFITENKLDECIEPPQFLTGDMDSVTRESVLKLDTMNCKRIDTPDQYDTDCTKSLMAIQPYIEPEKIRHVLLMTDFGGRIDQLLSQINTLFKNPLPDHVNIYLRSHDTLAWLLRPGSHEITVPEELVTNQIWCGYIPMNGSCCVTTTGFKWDLNNGTVKFGELISTSNAYKSSDITIRCDNFLLFSTGTCKN